MFDAWTQLQHLYINTHRHINMAMMNGWMDGDIRKLYIHRTQFKMYTSRPMDGLWLWWSLPSSIHNHNNPNDMHRSTIVCMCAIVPNWNDGCREYSNDIVPNWLLLYKVGIRGILVELSGVQSDDDTNRLNTSHDWDVMMIVMIMVVA